MFEKRVKKEDIRFVLQECVECGEKFPVIYHFKKQGIFQFGRPCAHVQFEKAEFIPVGGAPTFEQWYDEQLRVRASLVSSCAW